MNLQTAPMLQRHILIPLFPRESSRAHMISYERTGVSPLSGRQYVRRALVFDSLNDFDATPGALISWKKFCTELWRELEGTAAQYTCPPENKNS